MFKFLRKERQEKKIEKGVMKAKERIGRNMKDGKDEVEEGIFSGSQSAAGLNFVSKIYKISLLQFMLMLFFLFFDLLVDECVNNKCWQIVIKMV